MTAKLGQISPLHQPLASEDFAHHLLSDQVRLALSSYFARLDGIEEATDLHALVIGEVEKPLFETVLEHCGHNQSKAAQVLGISRSTLRKKITQYGIG
jgi:Fis family transcriptional regulator